MTSKVVFLGATKGLGEALAVRMARQGAALFLLGRDAGALERTATLLRAQGAQRCAIGACDLLDPSNFASALETAEIGLDGIDTVVVSAGMFATQIAMENDPELTARLLTVDFTNTVLFCEEARRRLLARGGGTLCVFSSTAGERGRKPTVLYGATKAGLSHYLEGLDHRYRSQGLRTIAVKPGFVRTPMTAGFKPALPFSDSLLAGEPEQVADLVLRAIERGDPEVYAPKVWRWVMWLMRRLPRAVMRRVSF